MIKLIAMDMDDTVLNNKLEISTRTQETIRKAAGKGIILTFATGRMYRSCRRFALALDLDVPLITYNGASIQQALSGQVLFHLPVPLAVAVKVAQWAERHGHHLQVYVNDRVYVREWNEKAWGYANHSAIEVYAVGSLGDFLTKEPTKMLIIADEGQMGRIMDDLAALCGSEIHMACSKPMFLEMMHPAVSKGSALAYLASLLNIERSEIMAIGDGCNDVEMLEYAGLSIAMENAHPLIRGRADYVTDSNEQDGVAKAIERFVLG